MVLRTYADIKEMPSCTTALLTDLPQPLLDRIVREAFHLSGSDLKSWLQLVLVCRHARDPASPSAHDMFSLHAQLTEAGPLVLAQQQLRR